MGSLIWLLAASAGVAAQTTTRGASSRAATGDSCVDCHHRETPAIVEEHAASVHGDSPACSDCHGGDPEESRRHGVEGAPKLDPGRPKHSHIPALCGECHEKELDEYADTVHGRELAGGAHRVAVCTDCHGAHRVLSPSDPKSKVHRANVPETCAACHSDVVRMNPLGLRTDQLARYKTSAHGRALEAGKLDVAICIDCHGSHDILASKDTRSRTHPTHIPDTCGRCHSDAALMSKHGLSTDAAVQYKKSVHAHALYDKGDISAPTCATCHGNHGATPPVVDEVADVCGNCHPQTKKYFELSVHGEAFSDRGMKLCVECHGNHGIAPATLKHYAKDCGTEGCHIEEVEFVIQPSIGQIVSGHVGAIGMFERPCRRCHEGDAQKLSIGRRMKQKVVRLETEYEELKEGLRMGTIKGLELEDEGFLLADIKTDKTQMGPATHSWDDDQSTELLDKALGTAKKIRASLGRKQKEMAYRIYGLIPIWAFLLTMSLLFWIKHRRLEGPTGHGRERP